MKTDAFISHASANLEFGEVIGRGLKAGKLKAWVGAPTSNLARCCAIKSNPRFGIVAPWCSSGRRPLSIALGDGRDIHGVIS
jgi:hypothetical protein